MRLVRGRIRSRSQVAQSLLEDGLWKNRLRNYLRLSEAPHNGGTGSCNIAKTLQAILARMKVNTAVVCGHLGEHK
jgi:hypothetical protein